MDGELVMLPSEKRETSGVLGLKRVGGDPKLARGGGASKEPMLRLTRRRTLDLVASEGSESARRGDGRASLEGVPGCLPLLEAGSDSVGSKRLFLLGTPLPRVETLLRDFPEVPVEMDQDEGLLGSSMKRLKEASQAAARGVCVEERERERESDTQDFDLGSSLSEKTVLTSREQGRRIRHRNGWQNRQRS